MSDVTYCQLRLSSPSYTGMDRAMISRLENGQIDNPTIANMTRYARAMGKKVLGRE